MKTFPVQEIMSMWQENSFYVIVDMLSKESSFSCFLTDILEQRGASPEAPFTSKELMKSGCPNQ